MDPFQHIVIIGGGIIGMTVLLTVGCSTAYYLSSSPNAPRITLVERCEIAAGASGKAGGLLALDWHGSATASLGRLSYQLHKSLADEHNGREKWLYRELTTLEADIRINSTVNRGPKWLKGAKRIKTMGTVDTTAQVHPRLFTETMFRLAEAQGVSFVQGKVTKILRTDGRVQGVAIGSLTIQADCVVVTAGPWSSSLGFKEIDAYRAHSVVIHPHPSLPDPTAIFAEVEDDDGILASPELYCRQDEVYICGRLHRMKVEDGESLPEGPAEVKVDMDNCNELARVGGLLSTALRDGTVTAKQACFLPFNSQTGNPVIKRVEEGVYIAAGQ